jgi:hypothetical protein
MNRLSDHIHLLGIIFVVWGSLSVLLGLCIFLFFTGIGILSGDGEAIAALTILATITSAYSVVTGMAEILAGWGLLKKMSWARVLTIVMAIINVISFPFGTALGVYAMWVLFKVESKEVLVN